ncbi:hypothetical protein BOTBODRAFT_123659 [Botryobasidium botryosum FD-172 SS1]|uniref:RPA43 OB domain-containing protein n=1 Tax=Botryobasidium botryosum (strain FD-172 SS1) TaxID=930990 RepID=A0A067N1B1_BOTB1|nr:hypothetical protein BOTBODRAFT_123659 [Botryobasidium botryosum FD-172 SS1]
MAISSSSTPRASTSIASNHLTGKKRKHVAESLPVEEPSLKKSKKDKKKKDKHRQSHDGEVSEKKKKSKSKRRHGDRDVKEHDASQFIVKHATLSVSIPPVFASDPRDGVEQMLDSMVMRYIPALQGVVLAHDNLRFLQTTGKIQADCPYALCQVGFDAMVWSPVVGMRLSAKVNLCSPDHISLLIHRTFNVSIPRHHIPADDWVFEYGPAENEPEPGEAAVPFQTPEKENMDIDGDGSGSGEINTIAGIDTRAEKIQEHETGKWVHCITGEKVGGKDGIVEITVVGLTIANQMLSLIGSLQPDPFSPEHTAFKPTVLVPETPAQPAPEPENEDSDSDFDDVFAKMALQQAQAAKKEVEVKEKKRKRKDKEKKKQKGEGKGDDTA